MFATMVVAVGTLAASCLTVNPVGAAPNFVLVLTDDLDKATLDVRPAIMPNLLTLIGQQGATFSNAFYNVPLCGPSRATILTGRYAQNTGVLNNEAPTVAFQPSKPREPRTRPSRRGSRSPGSCPLAWCS
jgi:arylsulfatase A-like enzyme